MKSDNDIDCVLKVENFQRYPLRMPDVEMMEVEAEEKGESGGVEGVVVDALPYIDHGQYCKMDHSN